MANKKITELPAATTPIVAGVKFEAVQGGVNVQVDATDMPGSGGGAVDSVNTQTGVVVLVAEDIGVTPMGNISSTDVQAALAELDADISAGLAGLTWKSPVRVATTVAGTLATSFENGDTVDGVVLVTGDRILLKNQADQTANGIRVVAASGVPARSADADAAGELEGAAVSVLEGTTNANTTWVQTTDSITLEVSNIVWGQFGSSVPDADASTKGIAKLYTALGTNTDGSIDQNTANTNFALKANLASPTFTGTPTLPTGTIATTQSAGNNTTAVATTAFVQAALTQAKSIMIAVTDESSNIGAGTAKVSFRMPYALTLTAVRASLVTAQASGSIFTVDINEAGSTILSTKLTIDNTELTSTTALTPAVISDTTLADDALITVDVDQIGNGTAIGLKVTLIGT